MEINDALHICKGFLCTVKHLSLTCRFKRCLEKTKGEMRHRKYIGMDCLHRCWVLLAQRMTKQDKDVCVAYNILWNRLQKWMTHQLISKWCAHMEKAHVKPLTFY